MGFTDKQIEMLNEELAQERVAKRKGARGMQLSYLEGYDVIDTFNRIFGYDGWNHTIDKVDILYQNPDTNEMVFGATCTVTITSDSAIIGVKHSDVGIGTVRKPQNREVTLDDIELGYKEAATDALKRAARALGNQFGNSLYDKDSPLHAASGTAAKSQSTYDRRKKLPLDGDGNYVPSKEGFAPNLRNNVPLSDLPKPNGENGKYACDGCGVEIKDSAKFLASEIAYMSIAQSGEIVCWNCKNKKAAAA